MSVLAAFLVLALTRAELIERMKAPPITVVHGLVTVYGDCDAAQRREFQQPIAAFAGDICRRMYSGYGMREKSFSDPGIVIHIGNGRGPDTNVVTTVATRDGGGRFLRIRLPSPGCSDMEALRNAVARGFCLAVEGKELDDAEARKVLLHTDPVLRARDRLDLLEAWRQQGDMPEDADDEDFMKAMRTVHVPGMVMESELKTFASRLYLYPHTYRYPFLGKYHELSFREAVKSRHLDPRVRLAAYDKIPELITFGGGHGEEMDAAVKEYCQFLNALAIGQDNDRELFIMLDAAEARLKGLKP